MQSAIMRAYKGACADAEKQVVAITAKLRKDPEIRAAMAKVNLSAKLPEPQAAARRGPDPDDEEAWNDARSCLEKA